MKFLRIVLMAATLTAAGDVAPAYAGCYRLGETGYHWYRYCFGPRVMYPHHRVCHRRYGYYHCYYR